MPTLKSGCFLIDKDTKKIALVYREKFKQFSFPKGHMENGETLKECAIRETEEETKRKPLILNEFEPVVEKYTTLAGEECECYLYFAIDNGKSDNKSTDTHETYWFTLDEVEDKISYSSGLLKTYKSAKQTLKNILK